MTDTELLARIDERTANTYKLVEEHGRHLDLISSHLAAHNSSIDLLNLTIYGKGKDEGLIGQVERNTANIWKVIISVSLLSAGLGSGITKIVDLLI